MDEEKQCGAGVKALGVCFRDSNDYVTEPGIAIAVPTQTKSNKLGTPETKQPGGGAE